MAGRDQPTAVGVQRFLFQRKGKKLSAEQKCPSWHRTGISARVSRWLPFKCRPIVQEGAGFRTARALFFVKNSPDAIQMCDTGVLHVAIWALGNTEVIGA